MVAENNYGSNNIRSDDASSVVSPMVHPRDARILLKIFTNINEKDI